MTPDLERLHRLADLADHYSWLVQERDTEIIRHHDAGMSMAAIAQETGLTRQRVHQIVTRKETTR